MNFGSLLEYSLLSIRRGVDVETDGMQAHSEELPSRHILRRSTRRFIFFVSPSSNRVGESRATTHLSRVGSGQEHQLRFVSNTKLIIQVRLK